MKLMKFVLMLMGSLSLACVSSDNGKIEMESGVGYVFGRFTEERILLSILPPVTSLNLENLTSHETTTIPFVYDNKLKVVKVVPGNYKIKSYNVNITQIGGMGFGTRIKSTLKTFNLPESLEVLIDIQPGVAVYIGDYYAKKTGHSRTLRIQREINFEKAKMDFEKMSKELRVVSISE